MSNSCLELTLAIVKPHAIKVPLILRGVQRMIITNGFYVVRSKRMKMSVEIAEKFYEEHKNKFFFNRLVISMSSGPSDMYILARENAITKWRELMGPTKVFKAKLTHPETIRGKYGFTDTRNVTHGSDSVNSATREITLIFSEFDFDYWYHAEENHFRSNNVILDKKEFVHKIKSN